MSLEAINAVRQMEITPCGRKFVAMALADYADENGSCYPSVETLMRYTSQGEKTVRDHLNALEEMGFLTRERTRNSKGQMGQYRYKIDHRRNPPLAKSATGEKQEKPPAKSAGHIHQTPSSNEEGNHQRAREGISQDDLDAIWSAYPEAGRVSASPANLLFMLARPVQWLGSVDAVFYAVRAYAAECKRHDTKPRSIANFLADRALVERYGAGQRASPASEDDVWRGLVFEFKLYGDWPRDQGPVPNEPGCLAPPEILAEFGYGKDAA